MYKPAATHVALSFIKTLLNPFDEDLPLAVAPLTTLLSTNDTILVGCLSLTSL